MIHNYSKLFIVCSLIKMIKTSSSETDDFWANNIWLLVILIILSIALIIIIVIISFKIYKKYKNSNQNEKENNFVNTERSSQKYISDYDKQRKNNKKLQYKERPLIEIVEDD